MLVIMGGYPFSGKTTLVNLIKERIKTPLLHIDIKDWFLPEYDTFSQQEKTNNGIVAWEMAMETLDDAIWHGKEGIIIYDTAAASYRPIVEQMKAAKSSNREVCYIFVVATPEICKERAGDKWIGDNVISRYYDKFKDTVPELKKNADHFFSVDNREDISNLGSHANKISKIIGNGRFRIHKSK